VRAIWVRCLADLIAPRLAALARNTRARPILPLPLVALQLAEEQLALISNWLAGRAPVKVDAIAEALIAGTRAMLAGLLRLEPGTPLFLPGETLKFKEVPG
jgi:hypothetical protein